MKRHPKAPLSSVPAEDDTDVEVTAEGRRVEVTEDQPPAEEVPVVEDADAAALLRATGKPDKDAKPEPRAPNQLAQTLEQKIRRREEDQSVHDWISSMRGIGPIQIKLSRVRPKFVGNKKADGHLDTLDEFISEDDLRERFGGGSYCLRVMRKAADGSWKFYTTTTVDIAGEPRMDSLPGAVPDVPPALAAATRAAEIHERTEANASDRMATMFERQLAAAESRGSSSLETMRMMMKPIEMQLQSTQEALRESNAALREAGKAPVNPVENTLLNKLIDQDSVRITAITAQLQSEMRTIKENAREDLKRAEDDHKRDMDRLERMHEREIGTLKSAYEQVNGATKLVHDTSKTVHDAEIRRTERELVELRAEVKELRAKKDQSFLEKAKEVDGIKELLGVGDGDDKDEKSTLEKIVEVAVNSDKLMSLAGKFMGPADPAVAQAAAQKAAAAQAAASRPRVLRNKRTGETFLQTPEGDRIPVRPQRLAQQPGGEEAPEAQIDPEKVAMARQFIETAFSNRVDPVNVATSIRSAVPEEILQSIRDHGVDDFLNKVAKLPSTSPLSTQAGRNWTRQFGKALVGE